MTTKRTIQNRVRRGAAALDKVLGSGWRNDINLTDLNLNSTSECVLGQEFGNYHKGVEVVFGPYVSSWDRRRTSPVLTHGFLPEDDRWDADVAPLTEAWRSYIERTRS
jgi:hypothetical protein